MSNLLSPGRVSRGLGPPLALFLVSLALRLHFFCGFILGDDTIEFALFETILRTGPDWKDQLHSRFFVWLFNVASFRLLGPTEVSFFLPTWLMSASLAPIARSILRASGYGPAPSFAAGLLVAAAPFEILIGSVRANDLILAWFLALGLLVWIRLEHRRALQGVLLGLLLWAGVYVKVWALYFFPPLALWFLRRIRTGPIRRGAYAFAATSLALHALTTLFWYAHIGTWFPLLRSLPGTYPVPPADLVHVLLEYPKFLFFGSSEFGTTLFGFVPWFLPPLLAAKALGSLRAWPFRLDRLDLLLASVYGTFFFLLQFFPNHYRLDGFYSVYRVFRYLTPISFPMALHLAKLVLDVHRACSGAASPGESPPHRSSEPSEADPGKTTGSRFPAWVASFAGLIVLALLQADEATRPGQTHRRAWVAVLQDLRAARPPAIITDGWLGFFLHDLYFRDDLDRIDIPLINMPDANETWLRQNQSRLPRGTLLLTGLGGYVHYGPHYDGFRLMRFTGPLHPGWRLYREYEVLDYLPRPERAMLWRWDPAGP